ncbi:MAG: hypothetical protein AB7K86_02335 [Rhodospirillales bacterium]
MSVPGSGLAQTRTQSIHQGEPWTNHPGGNPGRTTGRTGNQSPFGPQQPQQPQQQPAWPWQAPAATASGPLPAPYDQLSYFPPECRTYLQSDWRALEQCLLLTLENKPNRLPGLTGGALEAWGRSTPSYNCYAYAVNPQRPTGWVGPRFNGQPRQGDIPIRSPQALFDFFTSRGWTEIAYTDAPPPAGEERVVLYARPGGYYEHAAVVTAQGVFAKMGELGVFRFSSVQQMTGPAFGAPAKMFARRV